MPPDQTSNGSGFRVDLVNVDGAANFLLQGELDIATAPRLCSSLCEKLPELPPHADVVLNVSDLDFIDAAGLGVIVRLDNQLRADGRRVRVESAGPWIRRIFEIAGLDRLLPRAEAMERVE